MKPRLKDHRQAISTYRQIAEDFAGLLKRALGPRLVSVVLYGSVARGEARPGSDVYLLVVVDAPSPAEKRALEADRMVHHPRLSTMWSRPTLYSKPSRR